MRPLEADYTDGSIGIGFNGWLDRSYLILHVFGMYESKVVALGGVLNTVITW